MRHMVRESKPGWLLHLFSRPSSGLGRRAAAAMWGAIAMVIVQGVQQLFGGSG
jgi:hypothetical protein